MLKESQTGEVRPASPCNAHPVIRPALATAGRLWPRFGLAAILVTAVVLRGWHLGASGFITPYYLAGVRSMMVSWHNFFFNAFDPGGFLSLDKPPIAFWFQTGSAELFGFGPVSALLPQLIEGVVSIAVLYHLVQRVFGTAAGLFAALFLTLTPIDVAVDRSNNTEPCLGLILLLAAWAFSRAVETGRAPLLLLAAALVGIGFNTKMLMAFGVVPVFILLYLAGTQIPLRRRIGHLAAAEIVLATVSFWWTGVYDLTRPQDRPFVDSTSGNSMFELIVGENFIRRFVPRGDRLRQVAAAAANPSTSADQTAARLLGRDYVPAGPLRLASPHLAAQMGWLFPLALLGGIALSILLAMPAVWSVGTIQVKGNTGFPAARPPFLNDAAQMQRRRWGLVAGALDGDPRLIAFLRERHRDEEYLLAAVNARQAAPIIIATGDRVMAFGGFTGRDPILTVDRFARLVADKRVRFALIGDGSPGLHRVFGEDGQKPLVDWIREKGRPVDLALWRAPVPDRGSGGADGRAAEAAGAQLYDLRPTDDGN